MTQLDSGPVGTPLWAATGLVSCAVAAVLAAAPGTAQAAVPTVGAWESGSRVEPRVSFDVQGPIRARTVRRVSYPVQCDDDPFPSGWEATTSVVRVRPGGRFTAYNFGSVIRGRFTANNRAEVTVRGSRDCKGTRRYVVSYRGRRVAVRDGHYVSLVGQAAAVGLAVSAFRRMAQVTDMDGSFASRCSDGSERPLTFAGLEQVVLAAPIRTNGRFALSAGVGPVVGIAGTFDGASVAAVIDISIDLPSSVRCTVLRQSLVGARAFPSWMGTENTFMPRP